MKSLSRLPGLLGLALLAACGGSSSSDSSSDGGGGSGPTVRWTSGASWLTEDTVSWQVLLELNESHDEDIDVNFYWSGTASEFVDYFVPGGTPITIPAGQLSQAITVQVFEDDKGELDEEIKLTMVPPVNASLGSPSVHLITIADEDQVVVPEVEPNNDHLTANDVGVASSEVAYEVTGQALTTDFDVFKFTAQGNTTVFVSLAPQSAVAEAVLNVLDETGGVVEVVDDDLPGTTVSTSFTVLDGQVFFLAVTMTGAGSDWVLDVVGV